MACNSDLFLKPRDLKVQSPKSGNPRPCPRFYSSVPPASRGLLITCPQLDPFPSSPARLYYPNCLKQLYLRATHLVFFTRGKQICGVARADLARQPCRCPVSPCARQLQYGPAGAARPTVKILVCPRPLAQTMSRSLNPIARYIHMSSYLNY